MRISKHFAWLIAAIAGCFLVASLSSRAVRAVVSPRVDGNLRAYLLLCEVSRTQDYSLRKQYAEQALQAASDPDLRECADFVSRSAALTLSTGVKTFQEANSASGTLKGMLTGALNPPKGIEAVGLLIDEWMLDPKKKTVLLDSRYGPILRQHASARRLGEVGHWVALMVAGYLCWSWWRRLRVQSLNPVSESTNTRIDHANGEIVEAEQSEVIICPHCGTRNRLRPMNATQTLVCGKCKATLMAAA